jgi:hypothetical protein
MVDSPVRHPDAIGAAVEVRDLPSDAVGRRDNQLGSIDAVPHHSGDELFVSRSEVPTMSGPGACRHLTKFLYNAMERFETAAA